MTHEEEREPLAEPRPDRLLDPVALPASTGDRAADGRYRLPAVRGPGRVAVPLASALLGAVMALAAAIGTGVVQTNDATASTVGTPTATATGPRVEVVNDDSSAASLRSPEPSLDAVAVGEIVIPSIVTVHVGRQQATGFLLAGSGSGVVVDTSGHVVTNDHVVNGGSEYQVVLADGRTYEATLVGTDQVTDLAVILIDAQGLDPIEFGSSDSLSVGDPAIAVGNPLGLDGGPSLTVGVLSAFNRTVQAAAGEVLYGMLQTDAPITQGSSGGALVDERGRLIGITTAVGVSEIGVEGIGFATPVEIVARVANELIETGRVQHAYLGITGSTEYRTADDHAHLAAGVQVQQVEARGAAEAAGLEVGDVITAVEGANVDTMQDLIVLLRRSLVGDTVRLTVERGGTTEIIDVTLRGRP